MKHIFNIGITIGMILILIAMVKPKLNVTSKHKHFQWVLTQVKVIGFEVKISLQFSLDKKCMGDESSQYCQNPNPTLTQPNLT